MDQYRVGSSHSLDPTYGGVAGVLQARSWLPRTEGSLRLGFVRDGGETRLSTLRQSGAARARFPKPVNGSPPEAVMLNTAGGLTGGDRIDVEVSLAAGCEATITSAAAEKIYRSLGRRHRDQRSDCNSARARAAAGCRSRPSCSTARTWIAHTQVHMAADARLLAVEMLIYGRTAMGEDVHRGVDP